MGCTISKKAVPDFTQNHRADLVRPQKFLPTYPEGSDGEILNQIDETMDDAEYCNPMVPFVITRDFIDKMAKKSIFTEYMGHSRTTTLGSYRFIRYVPHRKEPFGIYREIYSEYNFQIGRVYHWIPEFFQFIAKTYPEQTWDLTPQYDNFFVDLYEQTGINISGDLDHYPVYTNVQFHIRNSAPPRYEDVMKYQKIKSIFTTEPCDL